MYSSAPSLPHSLSLSYPFCASCCRAASSPWGKEFFLSSSALDLHCIRLDYSVSVVGPLFCLLSYVSVLGILVLISYFILIGFVMFFSYHSVSISVLGLVVSLSLALYLMFIWDFETEFYSSPYNFKSWRMRYL